MDLKSMKVDPNTAEERMEAATALTEPPEYPYGLCLTLNEDSLEALGIDSLPQVGSKVKIEAEATVVSASVSDTGGGPNPRLEVQIENMGMEIGKEKPSPQDILYGS